jgi:LmbE family N-acetylglucosaminyl deacetylase
MLKIEFEGKSPKNILCLGAHCDDIEIGCGGAILKFIQEMKDIKVHWVVFSSDDCRKKEAILSAEEFLKNVNYSNIKINNFRNSYFPYAGAEIKEYFETLKKNISPDIIFTHCRGDLHQDHRVINELTWNTFRNHLIMEYEIAKYDADLGSPNVFVSLDENICGQKINIISRHFKSQADKTWFSEDMFLSVMRIRGMESNSPSGYAEGYYCRKLSL